MRSLGIEMTVRAASEEQFDPDGGMNAVETLAGREIANYIPNINAGVSDLSPTVRLFMTQHKLEPILRERAKELGADLAYATELSAFEQDADGVTATIRDIDSGATRTIRARYMVACDGNRSPIREKLGIAMQGYGVLSHSITIYFKADCSAALRGRNLGVICFVRVEFFSRATRLTRCRQRAVSAATPASRTRRTSAGNSPTF